MQSADNKARTKEARRSGRTHSERREEAARKIMSTAIRIIAEQGLDQLTLAQAGESAGYSRALPAHYFGSKNDLVIAVAEHITGRYEARYQARYAGTPEELGLEPLLR